MFPTQLHTALIGILHTVFQGQNNRDKIPWGIKTFSPELRAAQDFLLSEKISCRQKNILFNNQQ